MLLRYSLFFFFSSRRRHTRSLRDWSSDVCSSDLPFRIVNRAQYQQSDCGGTCQAVNNSNEQRAQGVKKAQPVKRPAQPNRRAEAIGVMFGGRGVRVPVKMHAGAVFVEVGMFSRDMRMGGG